MCLSISPHTVAMIEPYGVWSFFDDRTKNRPLPVCHSTIRGSCEPNDVYITQKVKHIRSDRRPFFQPRPEKDMAIPDFFRQVLVPNEPRA